MMFGAANAQYQGALGANNANNANKAAFWGFPARRRGNGRTVTWRIISRLR